MDITFEMEQGEWTRVNRDLRHHGLPCVELADPGMQPSSDLVTFSSEATKTLRQTIGTLIRDCDRRQELIQELIVTNNQLREDLKAQTLTSDNFDRQSRELRGMLEVSRVKTKSLEEELSNVSMATSEEDERLRNTKDAASARCAHLSKKCEMFESEIERLQSKLKQLNLEDDRRRKKLDDVMSQIRKKWTRGGHTDDNMLAVVDWYENQVAQLNSELQSVHGNHGSTLSDHHDDRNRSSVSMGQTDGATNNYKALIKSYERQLRDFKKKMKDLENEKELLKLDMESRPQLKDFRDAQTRVKQMERVLKTHGICPTHDSKPKGKGSKLYSTKIEDLEFVPVSQCRDHLKNVCTEMGVTDLKQLPATAVELRQAKDAYPRLEQFAGSVLSVVRKAVNHREKSASHAVWCDKSMHHVLPTLEYWLRQLDTIKELQESLLRLSATLYPWKQIDRHDNPTIMQMVSLVDSIIGESTEGGNHKSQQVPKGQASRGSVQEQPPREMLRGIVDHFQQLFDVPHVSGVYTRMNDVYTKLGEVHNILKTLRDFLGLDENCKPSIIVDAVAQLMESQEKSQKIQDLLDQEDAESMMRRLQEHEEFFPIFHDLLQKLLAVLSVSQLDDILPAIKALKLLAGC